MKTLVTAIILSAFLPGFSVAFGQDEGSIRLISKVEKQQVQKDASGKTVIEMVPAENVVPGDELVYTISYKNVGSEPTDDVIITNPIPTHTSYRPDSASGIGAEIVYSIDGGQSYAGPDSLVVVDPVGNERPANFKDYTHIKWTLNDAVLPQGEGAVAFRVVLN